MVMNFFGSPKGRYNKRTITVDDESLDSVSLNEVKGDKNGGGGVGNHDSIGSSFSAQVNYQLPEHHQSFSSLNKRQNSGIDAKLLKEERQLQKKIAMSIDKPLDKKVQKATDKRREAILKEKVKAVTTVEQDLINRCLGVDEDGYCLRHQDQKVRMGIVQPFYRFETISLCQSCAFGAESGIEIKNHGQKDKTISHAVNGALVATGVKKKKKKIKGAFAANMNGSLRVDLGESVRSVVDNANSPSHRTGEFNSDDALGLPSMGGDENMGVRNTASPHSRTELEKDTRWMEEVQVRVLQVTSWENSSAPLKCHPNFAKYFRMLGAGIPVEEIKETTGEDGPDLLVLSLDPEKSLNEQMSSLPHHIQDRLRSNEALFNDNSTGNDEESKMAEMVYQSYLTQLHVFESFLQEDEAGIEEWRRSFQSDVSSLSNGDGSPKKKKMLRLTKKIKRLVGASGAHRELSTDDEGSDEEIVEHSESNSYRGAGDSSPVAVCPVPLQPLPMAGLRRARRPNNSPNRRQRKPAAPSTAHRGVVLVADKDHDEETPMSPLTPDNGKKPSSSIDAQKMDSIMSTVSTSEDLVADSLPPPPPPPSLPPKQSDSRLETPSDQAEGGQTKEKTIPPSPLVITTMPSRKNNGKTPPPAMVLKSFPSAPNHSSKKKEEEKKSIDPLANMDLKVKKEEEKEEDKKEEEEKLKRDEMRKAVEAMHQFKLGSYDDSFGSIPTTVVPSLLPSGEPSIHTHLSSISSHSSDASSSFESESDSEESDSDDEDEEEEDEKSKKEEKETIDMDAYIDLSDKLIEVNGELFEAKFLLENSQKREEALLETNRAKDRKILALTETITALQAHVNTLTAQNAEAGKIMMELTASIADNKRQQLIRRLSSASFASSDKWPESDLAGDDSKRGMSGSTIMRRKSGSHHSSYHSRMSGSGRQRLSASFSTGSYVTEMGENDNIAETTPMMIAVSTPTAAASTVQDVASNVREVPPARTASNVSEVSSGSSNVRQITPKAVSNVRQITPKAASNVRQITPRNSDEKPDNMFPKAFNVREINPNNRRRIQGVNSMISSNERQKKDIKSNQRSAPVESPASAPVPTKPRAPLQPRELVIRSFQPSAKLEERRRRKRELEERLKISVARNHSADDAVLGPSSNTEGVNRSARTEVRTGGVDEEEL